MAANSNDLKLTLRLNAENKEFIGQVRASANAVDTLGKEAKQSSRELNDLSSGSNFAGNALSSMKGQVLGVVAGFSALTTAINAKDRLGEYQDMRTQITALVGSQEAWLETEEYLDQVAEDHNKTVGVLSESYARLLALENGGLITHQQVIGLFEGMSNAASANGASNAQLSQVMYGLQQAMASGVVRAEDFNQVTEPMPDLLIKLAAAANTTVGGLRNMVNSGEMTSQLFGETLVKALATYDGAAARTADNVSAQSAAFDRAYLSMVRAYETPISSVFSDSIEASTAVMDVMADNAETLSTLVGVTLFAAMGRGTAAVVAHTQVKINDIVVERQKTQATMASAQAELTAANAEIRRLETMRASSALILTNTGTENALAAARARQTAATQALTAAQARLNVVARAGSALMGALGGPVGIAMMAAGAIGYFALQSRDAEKSSRDLKGELSELVTEFNSLTEVGKQRFTQKISESAVEARKQLLSTRVAIQSVQRALEEAERSGSPLAISKRNELRSLQEQAKLFEQAVEDANAQFDALLDNRTKDNWQKLPSERDTSGVSVESQQAAERMLANLQRQVALYGQTSEVAKVRYEIESGSLKGINEGLQKQLLLQAQLIDKKRAASEAGEKDTDEIDRFYEESDAINTRYQMRLAIQSDYENKAKIQEQYAYAERQDQIQAQFELAYAQARGNQELMHDLEKEYFLNRQALRQEHELTLTEISKQAEDERQAYQHQVAMNTLNFTQQQLSITTDFLKQSGEEQSGIYRALFMAQKMAAIPSMIIATEEAAAKALTLGPIAGPIASTAVKTMGYASVGIVAGQAFAGQAHDGINSVPRENEGTWLLKANEMVLNTEQADNFRWMTGVMQQMKTMFTVMSASSANQGNYTSGGTVVNIHPPAGTSVRSETSTTADGQEQLDFYIEKAKDATMAALYADADNGGPVSSRIRAGAR